MRAFRRNDHSPRVEMMPLIDVIFLLLTFFIFQMIVMRQVDIMDFQLAPVAGGQRAVGGQLDVLSIDGDGAIFLNSEPIAAEELDERLAAFAADPTEPTLYISLAEDGRTDRGPMLFELWQRMQAAGVTKIAVIGQPEGSGGGGGGGGVGTGTGP